MNWYRLMIMPGPVDDESGSGPASFATFSAEDDAAALIRARELIDKAEEPSASAELTRMIERWDLKLAPVGPNLAHELSGPDSDAPPPAAGDPKEGAG